MPFSLCSPGSDVNCIVYGNYLISLRTGQVEECIDGEALPCLLFSNQSDKSNLKSGIFL
jgi:hypothetical protein